MASLHLIFFSRQRRQALFRESLAGGTDAVWAALLREVEGETTSFGLLPFFDDVFLGLSVGAETPSFLRELLMDDCGASRDVDIFISGSWYSSITATGSFCLFVRFRFFDPLVVASAAGG